MRKLLYTCCAYMLLLFNACRTMESTSDTPFALYDGSVRLPIGAEIAGFSVSFLPAEKARDLLAEKLGVPDFQLTVDDASFSISGRALGIHYDLDAALAAAFTSRKVSAVPLAVDHTVLDARIKQLAAEVYTAPIDAEYTIDRSGSDLFLYETETDGTRVDTIALTDKILCAIQADAACEAISCILIPTVPVNAKITLDDLRLQTQPLASFTTSFASAPLNDRERVFNIRKAAKTIHGTVLLPGEEFDCNAVLGDRNEQNGWAQAAAIRGGMYTSEYGGGVCQVSSTLFNAVMMADLPIIERYPHSWPMRYVSIGCDATISTGGKNFRFVNNRSTPIIIGTNIDTENGSLTCTLYGSALPQGQYIRIRSEQTATLDTLPEEHILDMSLPPATYITEREPRQGKTSVTYKDYYDADGTLLHTEIAYRDTYRSISARILVSADLYAAMNPTSAGQHP